MQDQILFFFPPVRFSEHLTTDLPQPPGTFDHVCVRVAVISGEDDGYTLGEWKAFWKMPLSREVTQCGRISLIRIITTLLPISNGSFLIQQ